METVFTACISWRGFPVRMACHNDTIYMSILDCSRAVNLNPGLLKSLVPADACFAALAAIHPRGVARKTLFGERSAILKGLERLCRKPGYDDVTFRGLSNFTRWVATHFFFWQPDLGKGRIAIPLKLMMLKMSPEKLFETLKELGITITLNKFGDLRVNGSDLVQKAIGAVLDERDPDICRYLTYQSEASIVVKVPDPIPNPITVPTPDEMVEAAIRAEGVQLPQLPDVQPETVSQAAQKGGEPEATDPLGDQAEGILSRMVGWFRRK